jgi:hypothetical protein
LGKDDKKARKHELETQHEVFYKKPRAEDHYHGEQNYIIGVDDAIVMSLYPSEYFQVGEKDEDVELEFTCYDVKDTKGNVLSRGKE